MGKINVLSFEVANLIAAGEVVDRPASVVKELLENAIDAGATRVTVEIQHGGITFIRVADNGAGMEKDDLPVAIRRHATSKIKTAADLEGIGTLGFRGEALAAIAAVSDLRIISRREADAFGAVLEAHGGAIKSVTEQGCPQGTTVIVENLFGNVPARRKFLKKDVSEAIAVSTYVEKIALSHPEIALRLIVDGAVKLETAGDGELKSAVYAVFGREFANKLIPVEGGDAGIRVWGFIGRSDNVRPKRNYENFFINGRYVNCRTAAAALEQAYVSYIPPEKFPCCVLNIAITPAAVDVNVHPAKLEVKFSNERPVFEAVYFTVRAALEANEARPELQLQKPPVTNPFVPVEEGRRESLTGRQITIDHTVKKAPANEAFTRMSAEEYTARFAPPPAREVHLASPAPAFHADREAVPPKSPMPPQRPVSAAPPAAPAEEAVRTPVWRIVGEVFHTYVIVECDDEVLLIDKHAAHERVLFERLKAGLAQRKHASQFLFVPLSADLSASDAATLAAYRQEVEAIGFSFAENGDLTAIPAELSPEASVELLHSLLEGLANGTGSAALARDIVFEKSLYQAACKAAIKGGRTYPPEYVEQLCAQLMKLPDITVCPHGRPVALVLTHAALDRHFGRT